MEEQTTCELCGREEELQSHHLIPRSRNKSKHNKKKNKSDMGRKEKLEQVAMLCGPCHKQLHTLIENSELARDYYELDFIRLHPGMAKFIDWISNKPPGTQVPGLSFKGRR